jgi:colicin import membrane protein
MTSVLRLFRLFATVLLFICLVPAPAHADSATANGGTGDRPIGGGLYAVYVGQIVMAVQPNFNWIPTSRGNLMVEVRIHVKVDPHGNVLECSIVRSSGVKAFDASAINAVMRTAPLPQPPLPDLQEFVISFNSGMW